MVYDILTKIKEHLEADVSINTVTFGDILEVDLNKQTIFPLAHMMVENATISSQVNTFSISLLLLDLADVNKGNAKDASGIPFRGVANEQDILNTMFVVCNELVQYLKRGDLFADKFQLEGDPSCQPVMDKYENLLVGWSLTLNIQTPNNTTIC
jgi:hypothetical protein